jgi:hypothetical protein
MLLAWNRRFRLWLEIPDREQRLFVASVRADLRCLSAHPERGRPAGRRQTGHVTVPTTTPAPGR